MKKMLIALFIMLILGIGIVGYTQASTGKSKILEDNGQSLTFHS